MRQKSGPRIRTDTRVKTFRYGLTTRCIRHWEGWFGEGDVPRETFVLTQSLPLRTNPSAKFYPLPPRRRSIGIRRIAKCYTGPCNKLDIRATGLLLVE